METLAQLWIIGFIVFWSGVIVVTLFLALRQRRQRVTLRRAQRHFAALRNNRTN